MFYLEYWIFVTVLVLISVNDFQHLKVAGSFTCPRRTVLDERLKFSDHSTAALIGSFLHQIFQVSCP